MILFNANVGALTWNKLRVYGFVKQSFESIYHKRKVMSPPCNPSIVRIINLI